MRYLEYVILCLFLVIAGCTNKKSIIPDNYFPSEIYASAQKKLQNGNYTSAIKDLEELENLYLSGFYMQQVQLDLIYAYYKSANLSMAKVSIDRFLRLNPIHQNIDYVLYVRGLTNMMLDENKLQEFFGIDRSDRSLEYSREAFNDFSQLIRDYPDSKYNIDVTKYLVYLKERLAKHNLCIVKYYNKLDAYVAIVNRVEKMLRDFPDIKATQQALPYMEKAYRELQLNNQIDKTEKIKNKSKLIFR
ncbi:outer membrane protein assembly factor BamD [Candidatus Gullanella endobia]|nr:outer membrane protein assembly factor BamD [Candidatus Gullanella endobia]